MGTFATSTSLAVKMVGTTFNSAASDLASACIEDAENEIMKNLSGMYDLEADYFQTSTSTPPMVRTLTENLAMGYMYECLSRGGKESYMRSDRLIKRVTENLKALADGTMQLFDTLGALIVPTNTKWRVISNTSEYTPTFGEDHPRRWKIDSTKLDDIADSRGISSGDNNEID